MPLTLTRENKQTLKELLETGRWQSESEVICYGLHLVKEQVKSIQRDELKPIPEGVLAEIYKRETKEERAVERKLAKASMKALRQALRNGRTLDEL